jgi:hypothetical protein
MTTDPVIDEIRRVRHQISLAAGHDLRRLKETFTQLEAQFDRPALDYGKERNTRDEAAAKLGEFASENQSSPSGDRKCKL